MFLLFATCFPGRNESAILQITFKTYNKTFVFLSDTLISHIFYLSLSDGKTRVYAKEQLYLIP